MISGESAITLFATIVLIYSMWFTYQLEKKNRKKEKI